jgi:hypothetical protein
MKKANGIRKLDGCNVKTLLGVFLSASQQVAAQHGLRLEMTEGKFVTSAEMAFRCRVIVPGLSEVNYREHASLAGLPKDGLGKAFRYGRHSFTITGFTPHREFEVETLRDDGERIPFRAEYLAKLLNPCTDKVIEIATVDGKERIEP